MKILNIKQFKAPKGDSAAAITTAAPQHGQLVNIKGELTQFVVADENCINCYYTGKDCGRIACGRGHYAEVKLSTPPVWPKEQA